MLIDTIDAHIHTYICASLKHEFYLVTCKTVRQAVPFNKYVESKLVTVNLWTLWTTKDPVLVLSRLCRQH